jgi:hypothetical protein
MFSKTDLSNFVGANSEYFYPFIHHEKPRNTTPSMMHEPVAYILPVPL